MNTFPDWIEDLAWDNQGLIPAIAQEKISGDVLMFAWMNKEALLKTAELGRAVYFSRSRQKLWFKGEESGHTQIVHGIHTDCDRDVILLEITQTGHTPSIACHTGRHSCFYHTLENNQWRENAPVLKDPQSIYNPSTLKTKTLNSSQDIPENHPYILTELAATLHSRRPDQGGDASSSYAAKLLATGPDAFLKKIGEEAAETILAAKDCEHSSPETIAKSREKLIYETADLWFHSLIALTHFDIHPHEILAELARRQGVSGLTEKANRKS